MFGICALMRHAIGLFRVFSCIQALGLICRSLFTFVGFICSCLMTSYVHWWGLFVGLFDWSLLCLFMYSGLFPYVQFFFACLVSFISVFFPHMWGMRVNEVRHRSVLQVSFHMYTGLFWRIWRIPGTRYSITMLLGLGGSFMRVSFRIYIGLF